MENKAFLWSLYRLTSVPASLKVRILLTCDFQLLPLWTVDYSNYCYSSVPGCYCVRLHEHSKKGRFCSRVSQLEMLLGGRRRWILHSPRRACLLQHLSAQHCAGSSDKLLSSKVNHNKHEGGWIACCSRDPACRVLSQLTMLPRGASVRTGAFVKAGTCSSSRGKHSFLWVSFNSHKPSLCQQALFDFPPLPLVLALPVTARVRTAVWTSI